MQVSFDVPDFLQGKPRREQEQWWASSKRLSHGTLVALWYEPDGPQAPPKLVMGTVAGRDPKQLAPAEPGSMPSICVK